MPTWAQLAGLCRPLSPGGLPCAVDRRPRPPACRPAHRLQAAWNVAKAFGYATHSKEEVAEFLEQTTGPEREELEAKAHGIENPWHEAWCA